MAKIRKLSDTELSQQIRESGRDSDRLRNTEPRAQAAQYDAAKRSLHIALTNGGAIDIPVALIPELQGVRPAQLREVELDPLGKGLLWRGNGIGLDFVAVLERMLGISFKSAAARQLGRQTSQSKAAAARANGLKGGRPRKTAPVRKRASARDKAKTS